jgi:PAS domain S-box-containing protein
MTISLINPLLDFEKLLYLASEVSEKKSEIEKTVENLSTINSNNIKGYVLQALFLKIVEDDIVGGFNTYSIVKRELTTLAIRKKLWDENERKFGPNSSATVIIVSGKKTELGIIRDTNNEILKSFGFEKKDVLGENISIMMPPIIASHHNNFMKDFFERNFEKKHNFTINLEVLVNHFNGYLIPSNMLIRPLPNIKNGLNFMAILTPAKQIGHFRKEEESYPVNNVFIQPIISVLLFRFFSYFLIKP